MFTSPDLTSSKVRIGAFALMLCATLLFWVSPQQAQKGAPPPNQLNGLSQLARLTASDGEGSDHFGQTIALSGDTVLVGTPGDNIGPLSNQGSAYVYRRSGNTWTQEAQLLAPDGQGGDSFGIAVAIAGDVAVIGSAFDDNNAGFNAGSVYVFRRTGTTWAFEQQLTSGDQQANDRFGSAVAINGDSILVGAPMKTVSAQTNSGAAYVFRRTVTWTQEAQLLPTSSTANAEFGVSVALQNNTAVVGAAGTNNARGAAYVFTRSGTVWTPQQTLTDAGLQDGDRFGQSVAVDADTALVGAPQGLSSHQGTAFVFTRSGTVWTTQAQLNASDGATGDSFGSSVALYADTALIGAPLDDVENGGTRVDQGSAYVFTRAGTNWVQQERINSSDGVAEDQAGIAVAIDSQAIVFGAWLKDVNANVDQGAAYVFNVSCPSIQITPASLAAGLPNVPYSQQLSASGGVAPYTFALTNGALPDGITLSAGGLISGTTTLSGSFNITVQVTDTNGCFASRAYTLTTGNCAANITFNPQILAPTPINEVYIQPLLAGGGASPYFFRIISGALPPGVDLNSPGVLNGTPASYGTYKFTVLATDANGCSGTRNFSLTITCPVITLMPGTVPGATLGVSYNQLLTPFGGSAPHTFTLIGSLPPGVSLSNNGLLSGVPSATGVFNFAAKVVDANGCTVVYPYSLSVCKAITLTPATIPGGALNQVYLPVTFSASGGVAPYAFALNGPLPSGMTFNQGTLSGTPFVTGIFNFTVTATDAEGCQAVNTYTLNVGNCSVALSPNSNQVGASGGNFVFAVNASGSCQWTAVSNAPWLTVTTNSSGTGSLAVAYSAAANAGATRTGQINVNNQVFTVVQATNNTTQDSDNDGIPDSVEIAEGKNIFIKDNDIFSNTAASYRLFVMQQYRDFLGREGDTNGIAAWVNALNSGILTRRQVIESFFNAPEFSLAAAPVTRLYFAAFARIPDYGGLTNWINNYRAGVPLDAIAQAFATSPEFLQTYGNLNNTQYVTLLYQNVLGRAPDAGGLSYWTGLLNNNSQTRGQVLLGFSESAENLQRSSNKVFVVLMYAGMLRRAPDQSGFNGWVSYLDAGNSRLNTIQGFLESLEYRSRFLP